MKKQRKLKAFTLIELLVVISIIGILATIVTMSVTNAVAKSRDSRRKEDLSVINKAIKLYGVDNRKYPEEECYNNDSTTVTGCKSSWLIIQGDETAKIDNNNNKTTTFLDAMKGDSTVYLSTLPIDPINGTKNIDGSQKHFYYLYNSSGSEDSPAYYLKTQLEVSQDGNIGGNQTCFGFTGGRAKWNDNNNDVLMGNDVSDCELEDTATS